MIAAILAQQGSCTTFTNNLYYGMMQNPEVRCLQQFLKSQGEGIYPEGLVTGNFLSLTKQAVIRFQEKYREEILDPIGLKEGTGFVGNKTRVKINGLISQ
jgi:peptidoglycan hydrolase-like protein with peptidoglycan-binding domain